MDLHGTYTKLGNMRMDCAGTGSVRVFRTRSREGTAVCSGGHNTCYTEEPSVSHQESAWDCKSCSGIYGGHLTMD